MHRKRNPDDNAKAESFMKTLKYEQVYLSGCENLADTRAQIGHFLEAIHNHKRLHSSLAVCRSPGVNNNPSKSI